MSKGTVGMSEPEKQGVRVCAGKGKMQDEEVFTLSGHVGLEISNVIRPAPIVYRGVELGSDKAFTRRARK